MPSCTLVSSHYGINLHVHATYVCSATDQFDSSETVSWTTDAVTSVVDNSANTHVWNRLEDFVPGSVKYFDDKDDVGVLTIGSDTSRPLGVGLVNVYLDDNGGTERHLELCEALYFPASPVRIISVTKLASQLGDPSGTWITT